MGSLAPLLLLFFRVFFPSQVVDFDTVSFREWKKERERSRARRERTRDESERVPRCSLFSSLFSKREGGILLRQRCKSFAPFPSPKIHSPAAATAATRRFLGLDVIRSAAEAGKSPAAAAAAAATAAAGRRERAIGADVSAVPLAAGGPYSCVRCLPCSPASNRAQAIKRGRTISRIRGKGEEGEWWEKMRAGGVSLSRSLSFYSLSLFVERGEGQRWRFFPLFFLPTKKIPPQTFEREKRVFVLFEKELNRTFLLFNASPP